MIFNILGSYKLKFHPNGHDTEPVYEVDFTPPFKRKLFKKNGNKKIFLGVQMYEELGKVLGVELPSPSELASEG